ncbi:MAG: Rrf2 family transcriptional regulator [Candidatus Omnitrophica bacterium]|nr:Rrf2 family transcriptional regulator [Candidatus Omnitrophota bacterium]
MISKTSLQTIKALLELAHLPSGKTEGVGSIARRIRAPQNYLGKVLQRLVKEGVVVSQKGLNGGFRLAQMPAQISLYDVVSSLEDIKRWEGCFMGKSICSGSTACSMHKRWEGVRSAYIDFLKNTTIADLKNN